MFVAIVAALTVIGKTNTDSDMINNPAIVNLDFIGHLLKFPVFPIVYAKEMTHHLSEP